MKESVLLSIVVPIYNVEKYVGECIESIINQKTSIKYEIILVNDGSTDNSKDICSKYLRKNILYFEKINGGLSDARNFGLMKANGKYIYFLDSDDCVSHDFFEKINTFLQNNYDVVLFDAMEITEDSIVSSNESFYLHNGLENGREYSGLDIIKNQLKYNNQFQTAVWLGIYKKELLINNYLFFEKGLIHEDEMWTPKVLLESKSIIYLKSKCYKYRLRENSIMTSKKNKDRNVNSMIYIFNSLYDYYDYKNLDKESAKMIKDNLSRRYLNSISKWEFCKYKKLKRRIPKLRIMKNSSSLKNIIRSFVLLLNVNLYCYVFKKKRG